MVLSSVHFLLVRVCQWTFTLTSWVANRFINQDQDYIMSCCLIEMGEQDQFIETYSPWWSIFYMSKQQDQPSWSKRWSIHSCLIHQFACQQLFSCFCLLSPGQLTIWEWKASWAMFCYAFLFTTFWTIKGEELFSLIFAASNNAPCVVRTASALRANGWFVVGGMHSSSDQHFNKNK